MQRSLFLYWESFKKEIADGSLPRKLCFAPFVASWSLCKFNTLFIKCPALHPRLKPSHSASLHTSSTPSPHLSPSHSLHLQSHLMTVSCSFLRLSQSGFNKVLHSFLLFPPHFTTLPPLSTFFQLQFFPFSETRVQRSPTNAVEMNVFGGGWQGLGCSNYLPFSIKQRYAF